MIIITLLMCSILCLLMFPPKVGQMVAMTRTRCSSFGYWCSTKGGRVALNDFIRLQGFETTDLPHKTMRVSAADLASALGNAMSLNVVMAILPKALYNAGLITKSEAALMESRGGSDAALMA